MAPIENDSDSSEDQVQDEEDDSLGSEEEGSEEGSSDGSDEDQPFPISVNTDESDDEDDSDEDDEDLEDETIAGAESDNEESDDESGGEEDDSNDEEEEVKPTKKGKPKSEANIDVKLKKKQQELIQKKVKESKVKNIEDTAEEKPRGANVETSENVEYNVFIRAPKSVAVDSALEGQIKKLCPLVHTVFIPKSEGADYCIAKFGSVEDRNEAFETLREADIKGEKFKLDFCAERGVKLPNAIYIADMPDKISLDELMAHFPLAIGAIINFSRPPQMRNSALIRFSTAADAAFAKEAKVKIGGKLLEIEFEKRQEGPPRYFAKPGQWSQNRQGPGKWTPQGPRQGNRPPQWQGQGNKQQRWSGPGHKPNWAGANKPNDGSKPQKWWTDTRKGGNAQNYQARNMNGDGQTGPKRKMDADNELREVPSKKVKRESEGLTAAPQAAKGEMKQSKDGKKEKVKNVQGAKEPQNKKSDIEKSEKSPNEKKMKKFKGTSQLDNSESNVPTEKKQKSQKIKLLNDQGSVRSPPASEDKLAKVLKQVLGKEKIGKNKNHSNAPKNKEKFNDKKNDGFAGKNMGKKVKASRG